MFRRLLFFSVLSAVLLQACSSIEYSPNQSSDSKSPRDLNKKSLRRLAETPGDDTIRFVLTGDSQREYKYSEKLVDVVNKIPGVDFVFLAGDISDFGLLQEMEWVHSIFSKLKMPYIGVIGNHDLVAKAAVVSRAIVAEGIVHTVLMHRAASRERRHRRRLLKYCGGGNLICGFLNQLSSVARVTP